MKSRATTRIFLIAFVIGAAAAFLVSMLSMLVSFDAGVSVAAIFTPAILMADRWPDAAIPISNGLLYGCLALAFTLLLRLTRR
jgi:thiamine transporter ThiT